MNDVEKRHRDISNALEDVSRALQGKNPETQGGRALLRAKRVLEVELGLINEKVTTSRELRKYEAALQTAHKAIATLEAKLEQANFELAAVETQIEDHLAEDEAKATIDLAHGSKN